MSFTVKFGSTVVGAGAAGGTGYLVYDSSTPKTIEDLLVWEGNKFISKEDKDKAYKAIWVEKKDEIAKETDEFLKNAKDSDVVSKLETFCNEKKIINPSVSKGKEIYEKVVKFCLDKQEKVKGLFTRNDISFIQENGDEDYKVIFALYKSDSNFINWVKGEGGDVSSSTSNENGKTKLKERCNSKLEESLPKSITSSHLNEWKKIYWWCAAPGFKTFKEKVEKDKRTLVSSGWEDKWDNWKNTEEITKAVQGQGSETLSSSTDNSTGGPKIQQWCKGNESKKLYEENLYPTTFIQFKSVCTVESS